MFYKERKIPLKFRAEEAIIRRLDGTHPKISLIQENHRKLSAGIRGGKELDYQLGFLPNEKYIILNDLRLQQNGHFFFKLILFFYPLMFPSLLIPKTFQELFCST
ncbi:hypothetical protein V7201_10955 [Bacillus sp. JJ1122]|uniref:hypothetical protein n=1 Tax=Bacillus sp. JJ1122 TaxID=3122951 RepID=UPI0030008A79